MYCLRVFIIVLQELHFNVCHDYYGVFIGMCIPCFGHCVSELHGFLRLFYKNYNVVDYCGVFIAKYAYTKFHLDYLASYVPIV